MPGAPSPPGARFLCGDENVDLKAAALQPGDELAGRYRVVSLLGRGGMGEVYEAEQATLGRRVALKVLRASDSGDDSGTYERFLREARVVARLAHPNIVTCHDFGVDEAGRSYLVMELVRGRSLRQRLAQGPVPWPEALRIARDVARALRTAHAEGIVHRDLKPENVMLVDETGEEMRAKVLDFGLAKLRQGSEGGPSLGAGGAALTEEGIFLGTPGYVAPEFAVDGISDDPRSDLYALGVILFELLTGQAPFQGQTALSVVMAHVQRPAPSPAATAPRHGIPVAVDGLVLSLLAKSPAARPADAETLLRALEELLQDPRAAQVSALAPDVATEASPELGTELRRALSSTRQPTPALAGTRPRETSTPATAVSLPQISSSTGKTWSGLRRSHAGRLVSVALIAAGVAVWSTRTPDLSDACQQGDGEACFTLGSRLEHSAAPDLAAAQSAYEAACRDGQRSGCERLERPWRGGVLREGFLGERGAITPYDRRDTIGRRIARQVFERLVHKDEEGRLTPAAIRQWELSPDGRRLTLHLREGARFQPHPRCFPEGRRATTADLAASLEHAARRWPYFDLPLAKDVATSGTGGGASGVITEGDVVTVLLKAPVVDAAQALAEVWLMPRLEEDCDSLDDLRHPAGTGPFRFVESQRDGRTVLTRDEAAGLPTPLDGVEYLPVGDLEEALSRMPERLDLVRFDPRVSQVRWADEEDLLLEQSPAGVSAGQVVLTGLLDLTVLEFNGRTAPALLDVEVRRAIAAALRSEELPAAQGMVAARGRFLPPWGLGFDGSLSPVALQPGAPLSDEQRARLAALPPLLLGYRDTDAAVADAVIEQLRQAGLEVTGASIPMQSRRVDLGTYGLFLERIRRRGSGHDALPLLATLPAAVARFGHQLVELEVLLELAAGQDSRLAREKLPRDLEVELLRAAPAVPLLFGPRSQREQVVLFSHRVRGLVDDTTRRVLSDETQAWLLPKAPGP